MARFHGLSTMQNFSEMYTWRGRFPSCRPPYRGRVAESLKETQRDGSSRTLTHPEDRRRTTIAEEA